RSRPDLKRGRSAHAGSAGTQTAAILRPLAAAHVGRGIASHFIRIVDLSEELNFVRMIAECREDTLVSQEQAGRVVTEPAIIAPEPPVSFEELEFDPHAVLLAADHTGRCIDRSRMDSAIVLGAVTKLTLS